MNGLVLFLIAAVVLVIGYILYGRWLCKQWGVGENDTETPAHTMGDGVDYVPAKAPVLMGHHFSSIAGAGPITGPINAAIFGWLPCLLWILIGGIFFGGVHDFGSLFASVRHGGKSIGEIISINMSKRAKRLFIIFAYLTLILVVAAFASIVAETFGGAANQAIASNSYQVVDGKNVVISQLETDKVAKVDEAGNPVLDEEGNAVIEDLGTYSILEGAKFAEVEVATPVLDEAGNPVLDEAGNAKVEIAKVVKLLAANGEEILGKDGKALTVLPELKMVGDKVFTKETADTNASVAMVSLLFIVVAIVFGFLVYRRNAPLGLSSVAGVIAICLSMALGMIWHPLYISTNVWMYIVGAYIVIASITPVWILLQPRDYLSSFLLYGMLAVAAFGVFAAHPSMVDEAGKGMEAFGGIAPLKSGAPQPIFPVLFTTIACGAISGFHSLVASGTTSKQLDRERDAKPIAYGGMLLECALAVITLIAVAYAYQIGTTAGATDKFAGGVAGMATKIFGGQESGLYSILYTLLVLTYSAFCLTSLDTATRMGRFMFQEFWLDGAKGETVANVKGIKKVLTNPLVATLITVVLGITLGMNGYLKIWALFGSANQLLAALALLAIATWLGNIGKNNKMFLFPMGFMLVVTIASLGINTVQQFQAIAKGGADWGPWAQAIIGILLIVLAVVLAVEGVQTLTKQKKNQKAAA